MLYGTDLGRAYYTSSALGGTQFVPVDLPLYRSSTAAFHPIDGQTAFLLLGENEAPGLGGWWRTTDEGENWSLMLPASSTRGGKRLLAVDPARPNHIYVGTTTGLLRSTDNGTNWSTIAFGGNSILALAMARDGSSLYVIPGSQAWDEPVATNVLTRGGDSLWRMDGGDPSTLAKVLDAAPLNAGRFFDIDVHPTIASSGLIVCGDNLLVFSNGGTTITSNQNLGGNLSYARYNPSNPQHLILVGSGGVNWTKCFRWSTNGGQTWNSWAKSNNWVTALTDYGPCNWKSSGWNYEAFNAKVGYTPDTVVGRLLSDFLPGNTNSVVFWGTSWNKGPMLSDDFGANFRPFAHGGGVKEAAQMEYGLNDNRIVVARTEYGVQLTSDGGRSWTACTMFNTAEFPSYVNAGVRSYEARSAWGAAFNPTNDNILLATLNYAPSVILRSEDFGATWTNVGSFQHSTTGSAYTDGRVLWSRANPSVVYVSTLRSDDGGRTFPTTISRPVAAVHPLDANIVVAKENAGSWWLSRDAGNTWTALPNPPWASDGLSRAVNEQAHRNLALDPRPQHNPGIGNPLRILVGGEGGVWQFLASDATGATGAWSLITGSATVADPYLTSVGKPVWLGHVLFNPQPGKDNEVYALASNPPANKDRGEALYQQCYRSTDYGLTWLPVTSPTIFPGELPNYFHTRAAAFSPSGCFSFQDYSGMFTLTLAPEGSLSGSIQPHNATTYNLSTPAYADWSVFGFSSTRLQVSRKDVDLIGAFIPIGSPSLAARSYSGAPWDKFSWSNGDNPVSKSNQIRALDAVGPVGTGLSIHVPAGTSLRRVTLWTSGWKSNATLTATLSDGSAPALSQDVVPSPDGYHRTRHVIEYRAGSEGQTMELRFVSTQFPEPGVQGNVKFNAIALENPAP